MNGAFLLLALMLASSSAVHGASAKRDDAQRAYDRADYGTAYHLYLARAERGEAEAQRKVGYLYMNGLGVDKDETQGRVWIEAAAEQGDAPAQMNLGAIYFNGLGVRVDHEAAFEWLKKAAENGHVAAQAKIGEMYAEGTGTTADDERAAFWYAKASRGGHELAQDKLLEMKMAKRLPEGSHEKHLALLEDAATGGDARAQGRLGAIYCNGLGVPQNAQLCESWLRRGAEGGDATAQRNLGIKLMNWQNQRVPMHQLSATFFSSKNGGPPKRIEINHDRGPEFTEAVLWFEKAARQFDVDSLNNLGFMRSQGFGAEKDMIEAYKWWLIAAAQGSMDARSNLTRAKALLTEDQAREAQRRAAAFSDPYAGAQPAVGAQAARSDVDAAPPDRAPDGRLYALVIGVENYRPAASGAPPRAAYAERDAGAVRDYLPSLGFSRSNIILLTGEEATHSGIEKYLEEWLPKNARADSAVLLYFAGSGSADPATGEPYLLPWDANMRSLKVTGFSRVALLRSLAKLPARQIVVLLDAGFSGFGSRSSAPSNGRPLVAGRGSAKAPPSKITLLTAARDDQAAGVLEDENHGIFTYHLLKAVRDAADHPWNGLPVGELHRRITPSIEADARRQNREQTPILSGSPAHTLGRMGR